jgi:hypothetical protein
MFHNISAEKIQERKKGEIAERDMGRNYTDKDRKKNMGKQTGR